ncbi:hypothetical protein D3C84_576380 [compost metagenome]
MRPTVPISLNDLAVVIPATPVLPMSPVRASNAPAFSPAVPVSNASVHLFQLSKVVPMELRRPNGAITAPRPSPSLPSFTMNRAPPLPPVLATVALNPISTNAIYAFWYTDNAAETTPVNAPKNTMLSFVVALPETLLQASNASLKFQA